MVSVGSSRTGSPSPLTSFHVRILSLHIPSLHSLLRYRDLPGQWIRSCLNGLYDFLGIASDHPWKGYVSYFRFQVLPSKSPCFVVVTCIPVSQISKIQWLSSRWIKILWRNPHRILIHLLLTFSPSFHISSLAFHLLISWWINSTHSYTRNIQSWCTLSRPYYFYYYYYYHHHHHYYL